eukprot:3382604-Alexandrium_andersonii.AAC.1
MTSDGPTRVVPEVLGSPLRSRRATLAAEPAPGRLPPVPEESDDLARAAYEGSWGPFRFKMKAATRSSSVSWQATCPLHRESAVTLRAQA